jgi:hypothetical protein
MAIVVVMVLLENTTEVNINFCFRDPGIAANGSTSRSTFAMETLMSHFRSKPAAFPGAPCHGFDRLCDCLPHLQLASYRAGDE